VRPASEPGVDFAYVIHNADGGEVENCGNGARCFVRFVHDRGLTDQREVRVQVQGGQMTLCLADDGRVTVDMGAPVFDLARVPFRPEGLTPAGPVAWSTWRLPLPGVAAPVELAVLSMGNPHAVLRVDDVDTAPVADWGPLIEHHPAFPNRVNAGFLQVLGPQQARLRVYERGAGETLACGTGACAAVVAGIRLGWLQSPVQVQARGGLLTIDWDGARDLAAPVRMTGPAVRVFDGEVELPDLT